MIGGRYEGDTGLIVRVEDTVVLFSDLTMHEVCDCFIITNRLCFMCLKKTNGIDVLCT